MVNLTIRLSKSRANLGLKPEHNLLEADEVPLASHFLDANLPIVKGIGFLFPETCRINFVGAKVKPKPGGKVHICLMCNFPIAVYGRLDPCQHALCFACAKSDSTCFVCKEKVVRIQKVDVLVGIFICGVPGCLRSFLVRPDFELHVANDHSQHHQSESPKGVSLGKPIPSQSQTELAGQLQTQRNSSANLQTIAPVKDNSQDERLQRRRSSWEPSKQGREVRENGSEQALEAGQNQRDIISDTGPCQSSRKRERERGGHPHKSFQSSSKQPCIQQAATLLPPPPPPPPYPLSNYPPAFSSLKETKFQPLPFHSGMGIWPRPEHLDATVPLLQHSGPLVGFQKGDQWPLNLILQEGFGTQGCHMRPMQGMVQDGFPPIQGHPRSPFFPELVLPIGMPLMSMPRFHEAHPPRPPPGPPPKQAMPNSLCPSTVPNLGELIVDHNWRPRNLGNFGGPRGGHVFTG